MLVGINGQQGDGKDTYCERAQHLQQEGQLDLPGAVTRRAFADKLKQSCAALFGITLEYQEKAKRDETILVQIRELRFGLSRVRGLRWTRHLPGFERIVTSQTMRVTLQRKGDEAGRRIFGDTFWIDQVVPPGFDHSDKAVFVTDVRYPNEAERIKAEGGFIVRVGTGSVNDDPHPSEQILDASLVSLEVDNSIRDDGFANLDRQVKLLAPLKPSTPAEAPRVIQRPTRVVGSEVRVKGTDDGE